jgi:hypothetical protein
MRIFAAFSPDLLGRNKLRNLFDLRFTPYLGF